ncbi:hypothetical protein GCM10022223_46990 [Kineosporia mesophila]|uniref:YspA cpYpsA-related SLOG domain-containing protein n=1 Tax=Kineosporia mesophila TaxID=566012 RepID=A0ABP7A3Z0_9ACTN|nr:DUF2493 domain-containing protein [Kineosporia mesophila]MCD5353807.1 DUF2493 domain-containing protein [Kineosporia mesophila]
MGAPRAGAGDAHLTPDEELIACVGGLMDGQWFTAADWAARQQTAAYMLAREQGQGASTIYEPTRERRRHRTDPRPGIVWVPQRTEAAPAPVREPLVPISSVPAAPPMPMAPGIEVFRLLLTGSRRWNDVATITRRLDGVLARHPGLIIRHGACPAGADAIAETWARANGVPTDPWPTDWRGLGRAAGPVRNRAMVEAGADGCMAFILDSSRGASRCADMADAAGIPIFRERRTSRGHLAAQAA